MLQIEIANGKGSYKPKGEPQEPEGAHEMWHNLELYEGQRARMKDTDSGEIINRITYNQLVEAIASEEEEAQQEAQQAAEEQEEESAETAETDRDMPFVEIPTDPNDTLREYSSGIVPLASMSRVRSWERAIDVVNYPVEIVQGYYRKDGDYVRAEGVTNVGRPTAFNFVVADKYRTGEFNPIAAVTSRYNTVPTPSVYLDLKSYMDEAVTGYKLREVYVSGDGGAQQLVIECNSRALIEENDLSMLLVLETSSDGSTTHQVTMSVWNRDNQFRIPVPALTKKLSARHTNTIAERTINFSPSVTAMLDSWNTEIVPLLQFFADHELDKEMALEELQRVAAEAGVGKRKREALRQLGVQEEVQTMFGVYRVAAQYIEEEAVSREASERWRYNIAKSMAKDYRKMQRNSA